MQEIKHDTILCIWKAPNEYQREFPLGHNMRGLAHKGCRPDYIMYCNECMENWWDVDASVVNDNRCRQYKQMIHHAKHSDGNIIKVLFCSQFE